MYITYETQQYYEDSEFRAANYYDPPKKIPESLPKPAFMPPKLVRISDMQPVETSQMNEGYCALAYAWNQSGEVLHNEFPGKRNIIDDGEHKIVYSDKAIKFSSPDKVTEYVKFEGIIQQICQQFNIKYIWYDKMCINQKKKWELSQELCNVHQIYENAYCTVALVPEFCVQRNYIEPFVNAIKQAKCQIHESLLFTRLWPLVEIIQSNNLLFVGQNIHVYGEDLNNAEIKPLAHPLSKLSIPQLLYYAHRATCTTDRDRVFALINLFPKFMKYIHMDYNKQPVEELMIQFYGYLARTDISILLFARISKDYKSTIQNYKFLPSWTGVNGEHMGSDLRAAYYQHYEIFGTILRATSAFITNDRSIINCDDLMGQIMHLPPQITNDDSCDKEYFYCLGISVQTPKANTSKIIRLSTAAQDEIVTRDDIVRSKYFCDIISTKIKKLSRFIYINMGNLCWYRSDKEQETIDIYLDDLTEDVDVDDSFAQHVILSDIFFKKDGTGANISYCPVIKKGKEEEWYQAIGCCTIRNESGFFHDNKHLPRKTFLIK